MKKYKTGILLGIISIISSLLLNGIPVGRATTLLIYFICFLALNFILLIIGLLIKNDKILNAFVICESIVIYLSTFWIEYSRSDYKIVVLGWLFSFLLSSVGIYKTLTNKKDYNYRLSLTLCIIGLVLSIANLILGLTVNGGFVVQ